MALAPSPLHNKAREGGMTAAPLPDPVEEAVEHLVEGLVHELRRAARAPIALIARGQLAPYHQAAVDWGWLAPAATRAQRGRLTLTEIGREILRQAGPPPLRLAPLPAAPRP